MQLKRGELTGTGVYKNGKGKENAKEWVVKLRRAQWKKGQR